MKADWKVAPIGAICEVVNGGTPKTGVADYWDGEHRWITPAEMGKRSTPYISETVRKLTTAGLSNSSAQLLPPFSVILSSRAPIGYLVINTEPMATNQGCKGLVPSTAIHHKFLYYFLTSIVDLLNDLGTGATFKELSGGKLKEVPAPVPPLPEQKRIVGILDKAFDGIVTAKANAEKNLQNARALFESHLTDVFTKRGEAWVESSLGQVTGGVLTGPFGSLIHKSDYVENEIPLVNPAHITETGIEPDFSKTVSQQTAKRLANYIMHQGDIVIGRRGEMGRCAVVTSVEDGWLCGTGSFFIKPSAQCDSRFLVRLLRSAGYRAKLEKLAGGAVMPNLSNASLAGLLISLPSVVRQREIVDELDALAAETQRLESIYQQKLAAVEALKKSLLHRAFSGQL